MTSYMEIIYCLTVQNKQLKEKVNVLENKFRNITVFEEKLHWYARFTNWDNEFMHSVTDVGKALGLETDDIMTDAYYLLGKTEKN